MTQRTLTARAVRAYRTHYTDPITAQAGDQLTLGRRDPEYPGWIWCTHSYGRSGWVPERYLDAAGRAQRAYSACELDMAAGEVVKLQYSESGWCWVTNRHGQSGWVPASFLDLVALEA